jgi:hypothetical protein
MALSTDAQHIQSVVVLAKSDDDHVSITQVSEFACVNIIINIKMLYEFLVGMSGKTPKPLIVRRCRAVEYT